MQNRRRQRKRKRVNNKIHYWSSRKKQKNIQPITIQLKVCSWPHFESCITSLLKETSIIDMDLKTWLKPIMELYNSNNTISSNSKHIIISAKGDGTIMRNFIPPVAPSKFHSLPARAQKRLHLATALADHNNKGSFFHAQFAFRLAYDVNFPFMVLFETISNFHDRFVNKIKVNGVTIQLSLKKSWDVDSGQYFMGNAISTRYYSYLPAFQKLFLNQTQQYLPVITLEFMYSRKKMYK